MDDANLFTMALQLELPWKVSLVEFLPEKDDPKKMALHITIEFEQEAKFKLYKEDGSEWTDADGKPIECSPYDTEEHTWQHLNFFQYKAYIHAKLPRIIDSNGNYQTVKAPWTQRNLGFTLLS